ncbi:mechanosensitive ion channel family protein [Aurantiacibacter spongiae]|uniref:Mechanosensitive ion channel protein n=1 Tax=Aurantiacibacter spongiae TaxID=2488860 RepID=A0A3N5CZD5_9SPHN|nr:mechanosensitive ion channel domain-containing protein [Aurantiacibacter spongiae]RPF72079.1 mechanosensitive ion channel protein [Aurantiacibacter spongiae]
MSFTDPLAGTESTAAPEPAGVADAGQAAAGGIARVAGDTRDAVGQVVDISSSSAAPPPEIGGDTVGGADALKDAVADATPGFADFVEKLDRIGFSIADTRFSLWTVLVVIMVVLGVILIARIGTALARRALRKFTKLNSTQRLLGEKLVTILIWAAAILLGLDLLEIDLTALTVFSGAFGLAIGFGLQKTFGNLIAGIILLMDRSIKPGDVINIADQAGNETFGQIRKIGIRAVSITTRDEREYLIPNENLMVNQVENWSYSSKKVRMQVNVGVSYGCDMKIAQELMLKAAADCDRVLKNPPPTVWMSEYGDSSVNFTIHCWIDDPEMGVGNVRSAVLNRLWNLFQESDIEIPFPQRDLNLRDNAQFQQLVAAISQRVEAKRDDG